MKTFGKNLLAVSVMLASAGISSHTLASSTTLVSITPYKIAGNGISTGIALSKSGLQSAFESTASNFVLQDGNRASDVFLRVGSTLSRVSVNSLGQEARNSAFNWYDNPNYAGSANPSISSDGKLVVFQSDADNLDRLTADTNNNTGAGTQSDVFLRDVAKKKTYRLSGVMDGADGAITPDQVDVDLVDIPSTEEAWKIMVQANAQSYNPVIAGTAKQAWVAFESRATNLTDTLTTTTNRRHIYAMDLKTKKLEMVDAVHDTDSNSPTYGSPIAEANANSTNPAISPDGRFVVYESTATNLTATNTGGSSSIFVYDRKLFTTYQLTGVLGIPSPTGGYTVTAEANDDSSNPSIAGGGKSKTKSYVIAFDSQATNLDTIPGGDSGADSDVFVVEFAAVNAKDANTPYEIKSVSRVSAPIDVATGLPTGEAGRRDNMAAPTSTAPVIAGTSLAYTVAFRTDADNLLSVDPLLPYWNEDSNRQNDIYVYNSKTRLFSRANVDVGGEQGTTAAANPAISSDGKMVGFETADSYLVPDVFSLGGNMNVYTRK